MMQHARPSVVVSHPGTQQVETVAGPVVAQACSSLPASAYWTDDAGTGRRGAGCRRRSALRLRVAQRRRSMPRSCADPVAFLVMRGLTGMTAGPGQYAGVERPGDARFDRLAVSWLGRRA
jgi:hypothetical protein